MTPDWLGSPQHLVAGAVLSLTVCVIFRRRVSRTRWVAAGAAVVATMAAESLVELLEYPVLYGDGASETAYYDTIADIGATLAGAMIGAGLALDLYASGERVGPLPARLEPVADALHVVVPPDAPVT